MKTMSCSSCGRPAQILIVPYCDACLDDVTKATARIGKR